MNMRAPASRYAKAALAFLLLEILLIAFVDRPLSECLRGIDIHNHALVNFFRAYTMFGKSVWYLWPTGIGALACFLLVKTGQFSLTKSQLDRLRRVGFALAFVFACVAVSGIATDILKPIIGRARPLLLDRNGVYGFLPFSFHAAHNSLPSGHATTAFALALALTALFPRGKYWFYAFAVAIAVSRVMVNAHYLSDVFAGAVLGALTVVSLQNLFTRQGWIVFKTE